MRNGGAANHSAHFSRNKSSECVEEMFISGPGISGTDRAQGGPVANGRVEPNRRGHKRLSIDHVLPLFTDGPHGEQKHSSCGTRDPRYDSQSRNSKPHVARHSMKRVAGVIAAFSHLMCGHYHRGTLPPDPPSECVPAVR